MQKPVYIIFIILLVVLISVLVYGFVFGRYRISVEQVSIESDKINTPVRMVHISDPHIYRLSEFENKVVKKVNSLEADIIAVTGDLFYSRDIWENQGKEFKTTLAHVCKFMETLNAKSAVYLCRGNNDISNDKEKSDLLLDEMKKIGVTVLSNRIVRTRVNNNSVAFLGVDYPQLEKEISDFWVNTDQGNNVLQTNTKPRNSYTHIMRLGARWENYTVRGKFRQLNPDWSGIGVTVYSHMDNGYDHFYRIRRRAGNQEFILSPHNTKVHGSSLSFPVIVESEQWYYFRIDVHNSKVRTEIMAKIWPAGQSEPDDWQIAGIDTSSTRLTDGTVGFWSAGQGINQFDDLSVVNQYGDTLAVCNFKEFSRGTQPQPWIDFSHEQQAIPFMADHIPSTFYKILLAHSPVAFETSVNSSVDLQLSGHTHGGQIRLPLIGPVLWHNKTDRRYSQGLFHEDHTDLYVNRGIGTVFVPVRLFCPPEITVITLK